MVLNMGALEGWLAQKAQGTGMTDGVAFDFDEDDHPEVFGPARLAWFRDRISSAMIGSDAILAAARGPVPWFHQPGIYFLIWQDRICYVGQAESIGIRIQTHEDEGRPIEKVAVILGIPKWAQDEFEHAYARAWNLPWNAERSRIGQLRELPELMAAAEALDRSAVMGWFEPHLPPAAPRRKQWELQVLAFMQAHPERF